MGIGGTAATRPTPCLTPLPLVSKVKTEQTATTPQPTPQPQQVSATAVQITDVKEKISDNLLFLSRKPLPIRWSAPPWPNGCGKGAVVMEGGAQEEVGEPA